MNRQDFWSEVFRVHGSVTPYVMGRVLFFVLFGTAVWGAALLTGVQTGLAVAPYEIVGVVLALLLVLRTNAGYDRWYEARKLWGGIVNQSRNLGILGAVYGPNDFHWQDQFARWTAAFSHACRHSLRGESDLADMQALLGRKQTSELLAAQHMPMYVAGKLGQMLRQAIDSGGMDRFAFLQAEHERTELIDHVGACERIIRTPLAKVFSIKIRRFLFLYLVVLPVAIVDKAGILTPFIMLLVAYPLLSLDQIGIELQSPFAADRLSHLPLDEISSNIEKNVRSFQDYGLAERPEPVSKSWSEGVEPHVRRPFATAVSATVPGPNGT
jgi:ion channel-forming bestrophin family protein